jgi:hypothetical protein
MTIRTLGALLLAVLVVQGTLVSSCGAQTMRMPCCASSSSCGATFDTAPCCGFDVPVDRQAGADRTEVVPRPSPVQSVAVVPMQIAGMVLSGAPSADVTSSPPHPSHVPLYIRFAAILC